METSKLTSTETSKLPAADSSVGAAASMRSRITKLLPAGLKAQLRAWRSSFYHLTYSVYDHRRFGRYSGAAKPAQSVAQQDAEITKMYHAIEKGLALPQPRPGFGAAMIDKLVSLLQLRLTSNSDWTRACANSINALSAYVEHAAANGKPISRRISQTIELAKERGYDIDGAATRVLTKAEVMSATDFDAEKFFWSRHSVRSFAPEPLDRELILAAIDLARSTPSVCNRQSARVLIVPNGGRNFDLLKHQNGNRGFGDSAAAFLVVTSDLNSFLTAEERYQAWIDGGMFSMALVLALHAKGLGACCLNWSNSKESDLSFRTASGLPDNETVIMLIAIGALPETLLVANSERISLSEVARFYEPING